MNCLQIQWLAFVCILCNGVDSCHYRHLHYICILSNYTIKFTCFLLFLHFCTILTYSVLLVSGYPESKELTVISSLHDEGIDVVCPIQSTK